MIQSIIFDSIPNHVIIGGIDYPINFGYRAMMSIEIEMFGENNDEQKILNALNMFYLKNIPENTDEAIRYMLWFHRCGEPEGKRTGSGRRASRAYCFKQDAPYLYAAFLEQYGIDLRRTKSNDLHWWEFMAMFESLSEGTKMAKIMYWRTCDLNQLSKREKKFVKAMRNIYAIKTSDENMDSRTKLAKRNADMKEYVRKRMEECGR